MDIASIPIIDFLKYCTKGAREKGYNWIVCILSRSSDNRELYDSIKYDWRSLDSITGKNMLVLLAGNEEPLGNEYEKYHNLDSCITDTKLCWMKRYNPFATIIGEKEITADLSSVRYDALKEHIDRIERSQTDAVDSLKSYFGLEERNIPCLIFIPLHRGMVPVNNIVVPIPEEPVDLYRYFKMLFEEISPLVGELKQEVQCKMMQAIQCSSIPVIGKKINANIIIGDNNTIIDSNIYITVRG